MKNELTQSQHKGIELQEERVAYWLKHHTIPRFRSLMDNMDKDNPDNGPAIV